MGQPPGADDPRHIGPYEIAGVLGRGGMGVVYRARDPRLGRDVALKVIQQASVGDARWRQRFIDEARAAGAISHPNILAVYDVAFDVDCPFIVSELVDGGSLRDELKRGPLRLRRLLEIAVQIADGLAAAHAANLVHRDLKPENVMVSASGRAKIVDFGLAKAIGAAAEGGATRTLTAAHAVVGTPAYMSPEQARGDAAIDFRSDIFAFGAVLYEMATGRLAFERPTSVDTMSAILHDEPRPLSEVARHAPTDLQRIVERCLAKAPLDRYAATADLLHDLRWLQAHPDPARQPDAASRQWWRRALPIAAVIGVAATAFFAGRGVAPLSPPSTAAATPFPTWLRLTFDDDSFVHQARFGPDGQSVLYSLSAGGAPFRIYTTTSLSPESRAVELPPAGLLAVSRTGQLALSLNCGFQPFTTGCSGTLARAPLLGGAPRALSENALWADWGPNDRLAVIVGGRLEYPVGTVVAESASQVRISPDGSRLASLERRDGTLALVVRGQSDERVLSAGWDGTSGLAWTPDGMALLISGFRPDVPDDAVMRIGLDGSARIVLRASTRLRVLDANAAGEILVDVGDEAGHAWVQGPTAGEARRDLAWLGSSVIDALSRDGRMLLMTVRGGPTLSSGRFFAPDQLYPIYVRPTSGEPAVFLGNGYGLALSPDGRWALTVTRAGADSRMVVYPLGPGSARTLDRGPLQVSGNTSTSASFASANRIVFAADSEGQRRAFVQSIDAGPPTLLAHEPGFVVSPVAPDGDHFISQRADGSLWLASVTPGRATPAGFRLERGQWITAWAGSERVFVASVEDERWVVRRIDVGSGRAEIHQVIRREMRAEGGFTQRVFVSADGATIAYYSAQRRSTLFLVKGVR